MRKMRATESEDERSERLIKEVQERREEVIAEDALVDRMIKRNIELYGA